MAKRVQRVRHETAASAAFTGLEGEITVDLGKKVARVHDGFTPGGKEQAAADLSNVVAASAGVNAGKMTAAQATELADATAKDITQDGRLAVNEGNIASNTASSGTNTTNIASNTGRITATEIVANAAAPIASPALTGTPTAPTLAQGNSGLGIATSAFVQAALVTFMPPVTLGTATAYTATTGITAYTIGMVYKVRVHVVNTGSATIALDGLAATSIVYATGLNLLAGEFGLDLIAELYYDGTDFILLNPSVIVGDSVFTMVTTGAGTITLNTSFNTLHHYVNKRLCHLSGDLLVSSIAGGPLTGFISMPTLPFNTSKVVATAGTYAGLAGVGANGVQIRVASNQVEAAEITPTAVVGLAPLIQASTQITVDITYPIAGA